MSIHNKLCGLNQLSNDKLNFLERVNMSKAQLQSFERERYISKRLSNVLTKCGIKRENIVSRIKSSLSIRYGRSDIFSIAIDSIRPVVKYYKEPKFRKTWIPYALPEKSSIGIALRWFVETVSKQISRNKLGINKKFGSLERCLENEFINIIDGKNLYLATKKLNFHKNLNS